MTDSVDVIVPKPRETTIDGNDGAAGPLGFWRRRLGSDELIPLSFAALCLVLGLVFSALDKTALRIAGQLMAAGGSFVISWILATVSSEEKVTRDRNERLVSVCSQLGTASSQLSHAVNSAKFGGAPADLSLGLVAQANLFLSNVISEIQKMTGQSLDTEAMIETVTRLESLADSLSRMSTNRELSPDNGNDNEIDEITIQLEQIRRELSAKTGVIATAGNVNEPVVVSCPSCGEKSHTTLGTMAGSSGMATCSNCGARFHVHRRPDSTVFSNRLRSNESSGMISAQVACPKCGHDTPFSSGPYQYDVVRFCVGCGAKIHINAKDRVITACFDKPIGKAEVVGLNGTKAVVRCLAPGCGEPSESFYKLDRNVFAVCRKCDQLVVAEDE